MMKNIFCLVALLIFLAPAAFAKQTAAAPKPKAEKIDEFGPLGDCDLGARFDNFLIELHNKPAAAGYFVFYRGADALPGRYNSHSHERIFRNHILFRNFDPARIVFIDGGYRRELSTELWIAPAGADAPKPSGTVPKPKVAANKTLLFDQSYLSDQSSFDYSVGYELPEFILPSVKARLDEEARKVEEEWKKENPDYKEQTEEAETDQLSQQEKEELKFHWTSIKFGEILKERKSAKGFIVFYADEQYFDVGKLYNHVAEGRRRIAEAAKIEPARIQILFGGYRNHVEAEFWLVPKNGEHPLPKPEPRPVEETDETETIQ